MSSPTDPTRASTPDVAPMAPAPNGDTPRDAAYWAKNGARLKVGAAPHNQVNNVDGRNVVGPLQGFGKMWQKTYRVGLVGAVVEPAEVIRVWKDEFSTFWPEGNRFYAPLTGIAPGEVALLTVKPAGLPLSTGVLVLYADDDSFTLMTPEGHMFAGWITFSAYEQEACIMAQAQVLMRANDPIYELGLRLGGHQKEDVFWQSTLRAVAARFGVGDEPIHVEALCLDPKLRWSHARNIVHNAAIRTILLRPPRWFRRAS